MIGKKIKTIKNGKSKVALLRKEWEDKGYDLINITTLCEAVIGTSGSCNDINEPDESIHHIQIRYREETIANMDGSGIYVLDDDKYLVWVDKCDGFIPSTPEADFIIFRKVNDDAK
jgi:hypothetical protein